MKKNKTLMQYFEWYTKPEDELWKKVSANANYLQAIGIIYSHDKECFLYKQGE